MLHLVSGMLANKCDLETKLGLHVLAIIRIAPRLESKHLMAWCKVSLMPLDLLYALPSRASMFASIQDFSHFSLLPYFLLISRFSLLFSLFQQASRIRSMGL